MARLKLSEEEKIALIEALNNDTEPNPELLPKLFPGTSEKFDVVSLDRAKIPTLEYAGKRSKAAILAEASAGIGAAPLQVSRCFGETKNGEWKNLIVQGDNLQFLKTCYRNEDPLVKDKIKGQVRLIYIDPPFATKSDFGGASGEKSYTDKIVRAEFLESLRNRLIYLRELLHEEGSIYLHLDIKMTHPVKVIMDEIFGNSNLVNEIVWKRRGGSMNQPNSYGNVVDYILVYSKTSKYKFYPQKSLEDEGTQRYIKERFIHKDENGRVYMKSPMVNPSNRPTMQYEYKGYKSPPKGWLVGKEKMEKLDEEGKLIFPEDKTKRISRKIYLDEYEGQPIDCMWDDIYPINPMSKERVDYPTQKPETLLERVIRASTDEGDIVIDCFAGSGTTPAVAEKLNRRWIACDFGKHAIYTIQRRLMRISESKALQNEVNEAGELVTKKGEVYGKPSNPFCVLSSGAYDFSHVMELREHKDNYVNFVLGLFQLSKDGEASKKFKSSIIFAEKNGHPVEVYPVWEDEFLKDVRIDEEYLEGIIAQSGGKLKGEYYIITPETCTNVGDTTLKNDKGGEVTFKMLTFPYKVLEDVSRKLELQDQPSKPDDVNQLISSTAFYFNEDVEISVKRNAKGLQITHFDTKILDGQGNRFEGFKGLAMLLVDDQYEEGKPFDMDKTVFLKDVKEDGSIIISGLGKSVGVIAIDKHGNESKPVKVE